jgi:hypothetical protein
MHYYEWNNLVGHLLFNASRAGRQVLLYLTREEIVQAALDTGHFENRDEAWASFSRSPRRWFGSNKNLIECIADSLTRSQQITIGGVVHKTEYPVCLTLLVQSVMPLIDGEGELVSQADYYNQAAEYAHQHGFAVIIPNNASQNWNAAWQQIQRWSTMVKNSQLGRFALNDSFGHIYVGKPFSQCLLPPQAIRDLPRAFVRAGWVPRQQLDRQHWQALLTSHCHDLGFRQAALKTLRTEDGLNYAHTILQERFDRWDGTTQTAALATGEHKQSNGTTRRTQTNKEDTLARFYLTFSDLDDTEGRFKWCYRIRASQTLPDTLRLNDQTFAGQLGGWSSAVEGAFEEGKWGYDALNKWRIKWPDAPIRLFESGQWHGLSSRVWVEVNELSRVNKMWAICRPDQKSVMQQWGTTFNAGQFKEHVPD